MDELITLDQVRQMIRLDDVGKWDEIVQASELELQQGTIWLPAGPSGPAPRKLALTPWALRQLCERLGIPAPYFDRCSESTQESQFAFWLGVVTRPSEGSPGPKWLLRARTGSLRGVLSSQYTVFDNADLLDLVAKVDSLKDLPCVVQLCEESLHVSLVDPSLAVRGAHGVQFVLGVRVANSEVGRRPISIDALVYRPDCGCSVIARSEGRSVLRRRHLFLDRKALARDLAPAAAEALRLAALAAERWMVASGQPLTNPDRSVSKLAQLWSLTRREDGALRHALASQPEALKATRGGLIAAVAVASATLPPDDRYAMELRAGHLLSRT